MRYLSGCIVFLFVFAGRLTAQPGEQFIFSHLGTRDGLATNEIMTVRQDKKGFIWIATLNGLQRYDGQRFLTFLHKPGNPRSIPDNRIFAMQMDQQDRLWLLFGENRVGYLNVSDFSFHEMPVRLEKDVLKRSSAGLFTDNNGNILLLVERVAILTYNEKAGDFAAAHNPFVFPQGWKPAWVIQDKQQNNYWIACDSGLVKYNPKSRLLSYRGHNAEQDAVIQAFANVTHVSHPYEDASGRFWLVSWPPRGPGPFFYSYDRTTKKTTEWETGIYRALKGMYHEIYSITEQDDGTLWISGLNLFAKLPRGGNSFQVIPNNLTGDFSIRYDRVKNLFEDKEKNIWVSTDKGLFRFNLPARLFQIIANRRPGKDSAYTSDVTDILQTKNGDMLVSTWGNGLFRYDRTFKPLPAGYISQGTRQGEVLNWCIHQRPNGDIWRGSQDGVIFITPAGTNTTTRIRPAVFEESTIRQITEDQNGNLWLGTQRGHLVKWDAASNTFTLVRKLSTIYRLYTDKAGTIWVCTGGNGVYRINASDGAVITNYTFDGPAGKKLRGIGAMDILQYNDSIYIAASGSLNLINIKTGDIRFFGAEEGLPSNAVNNIIRDKQGYIWLTTESRLCRLNLERAVTSLFTEEDGLTSSAFNEGSANMLPDGRIVIGRTHDFIVFDPQQIKPDAIPVPPVEITGFALMNTWLPVDSLRRLPEIRLKYNQNSVAIEFSTLTYLNQFAIAYRMEGLEKEWTYAGKAKQAVYNYLPPGNYTFQVKSDNGEAGMAKITTLKISIRTPYWKTWWFYSVLVLLIVAFFYWDDKERMRRKATLQKMRSNIAGNLHEEINTALNNINVLSEIARIKADKDPEQSITYINEIHRKSHNMIIAMDDMLWSIDPANDSMAKTIARIREFADALRNREGVIIHLQTDEKVISLQPDMIVRHEVMIIYKLSLRLLVEELKAPQTSIQLDYLKSQLQLNVFAYQVRLPDQNNQVIKIIEEMKTRAAAIMASLEIQSDEKGTAIILAVKV